MAAAAQRLKRVSTAHRPGRGLLASWWPALPFLAGIAVAIIGLRLGVGSRERPGPGLFPVMVGALIALASLSTLAEYGIVARRRVPQGSTRPETAVSTAGQVQRACTVALFAAAYVFLAEWVGHLMTSTVLVTVTIRLLGSRSWWSCLAVGIGVGLGTYLLFETLLDVPLPNGYFGLAP